MSLQRNYLGAGINAQGISSQPIVDGLVPQTWAGGPPMQTISSNANVTVNGYGPSGAYIVMSQSANITLTLPAPNAGSEMNFTFLTGSNANTVNIVSGAANSLFGPLYSNGAVIACNSGNAIKINTTSILGDRLTFLSDGTRYFVAGLAQGATAYTVS